MLCGLIICGSQPLHLHRQAHTSAFKLAARMHMHTNFMHICSRAVLAPIAISKAFEQACAPLHLSPLPTGTRATCFSKACWLVFNCSRSPSTVASFFRTNSSSRQTPAQMKLREAVASASLQPRRGQPAQIPAARSLSRCAGVVAAMLL